MPEFIKNRNVRTAAATGALFLAPLALAACGEENTAPVDDDQGQEEFFITNGFQEVSIGQIRELYPLDNNDAENYIAGADGNGTVYVNLHNEEGGYLDIKITCNGTSLETAIYQADIQMDDGSDVHPDEALTTVENYVACPDGLQAGELAPYQINQLPVKWY